MESFKIQPWRMKVKMDCDILIIGGGPAGSSAAYEASLLGAHVIVVERKKEIGQPIQCGELVSASVLEEFPNTCIHTYQEFTMAKTIWPDQTIATKVNMHMIDRGLFDKNIAVQAAASGAQYMLSTYAEKINSDTVLLRKGQQSIQVTPRIIIGADGPLSTVGKWMGQTNKEFCLGLQYELPRLKRSGWLEFYLKFEYFAGYAWFFPKGPFANVGLCIKKDKVRGAHKQILELLKIFIKSLVEKGKVADSPLGFRAGLIPVGGLLQIVKNNMMLVGDSAGQTDPIAGGGILQAIKCGKIAGKVATDAIRRNDLSILHQYEDACMDLLMPALSNAYKRRQTMETTWDNNFNQITKKCWEMTM